MKRKGKNWKKKYCRLKNEHLLVAKNDPKNPTNFFVKDKILLLSAIIRQEEDYFSIIPLNQQKWEFKAENAREVNEWINELQSSIRKMHGKELLFSKIEEESDIESITSILKSGFFGKKEKLVDELERTPLHLAAKKGSLEVIAILLDFMKEEENSIDINHTDIQGWTALALAVRYNHPEVVSILLKSGAEVHPEFQTMYNNSLLIAVDIGNRNIVRLLLQGGANINVTDASGVTALHTASENCNPDMVLFLIENGANVGAIDTMGQSPLSLASAYFPSQNAKIVIAILAASLQDETLTSLSLHVDILNFIRDSGGEDEYVSIYRGIRRTRRLSNTLGTPQ